MPNRILREGILTSRPVNQLSEKAELFYRRAMSKLDDYGRCEADAELLRTSCYPLRVDRVKAAHIEGWIKDCEAVGLLVLYMDKGKRYLQYTKFKQQERTDSKFPAPDKQLIATAEQILANAHLVVGVVVGVSEGANGGAPNGSRHVHDESQIVITLPLREGGEFDVRQSLVAEVEPLCPQVDVPETLKEMKLWLVGNPRRRKTRGGIKRFITSWLKSEQEKLANGR